MTEINKNGSLEGLSERAYEIARRRQAAAAEVVAMLEGEFETTFESHAATLLHAATWLAGGSLRRSFEEHDPASGDDPAPERPDEEMKLMKVFMFLMDKDGVKLKPEEYASEIPAEQKPRLTSVQVDERFGERFDAIMKKNGFDFAEGARTGAVVCARLAKIHCLNRHDLDPKAAASIVSMGFVEGA